MGCAASRSSVVVFTDPVYIDINRQWDMAWKTVETHKIGGMEKKLIVKRRGWKTVRIFVSSTFRDFHQERECLVKKVLVYVLQYNFVIIIQNSVLVILKNLTLPCPEPPCLHC